MTIRHDADELIEFLDSLAKIDPQAMGALIAARVPCNAALAAHPTVQVSGGGERGYKSVHVGDTDVPAGEYRVGFLGILNGYLGAFDDGPRRGWGPLCAIVEYDGTVSRFCQTQPPKTEAAAQ